MGYINKKNKVGSVGQGVAPYLAEGELGIDLNPADGDVGRVYVGDGSDNVALAKKDEVDAVDVRVAAIEDNTTLAEYGITDAYTKAEVDTNIYTKTEVDTKLSDADSSALALSIALG